MPLTAFQSEVLAVIVANRSEESHFAGGLVLNASEESARFSNDFDMAVNKALALSARTETRDYIDILELSRIYPLEAIVWAACGKDEGFSPLFLLKMMRRFAKIDTLEMDKIRARNLNPIEMKMEWITISDKAEAEMIKLADTQLDMPIGVAFVNEKGEPGWIGDTPDLKIHHGSLRGCWPRLTEVED